MPPDPPSLQKSTEQATLDKLHLEIAALNRAEKFDAETEEQRKQKLHYDTESVRWQTSLVYRLSQLATILTVLATLFGIFSAYQKLVTDRRNELEQKEKELVERTSARYNNDLRELLQYPIEPKQTIAQAVFLFRDLESVVNTGFEGQPEKREEVGFLITQLIKSAEFDLSLTRNSNFDRKALESSKFYENYLLKHPLDNRDILSKYKSVLLALHDQDPEYYEKFQVNPEDPTAFIESKVSKDQTRFFQYAYLFHAYRNHYALLKKSAEAEPGNQFLRSTLDLAFCWFWTSSRNPSLTKGVFGGTDEQVATKAGKCPGATGDQGGQAGVTRQ